MPKTRKPFRSVLLTSEIRKEKNKISAAKSRENKKAYILELQMKIDELQREIQNLKDQLCIFKQPHLVETILVNPDDLFNPLFSDFT